MVEICSLGLWLFISFPIEMISYLSKSIAEQSCNNIKIIASFCKFIGEETSKQIASKELEIEQSR